MNGLRRVASRRLDGLDLIKLMAKPKTVNISAAKTHLSRLVKQASRGTEFIIVRAGRPVAKLGPLAPTRRRRRPGLLRHRVRIAANFDAPLPAKVLDAFEGR